MDYDKKSPTTIKFFKKAQNKIHYEIINDKAKIFIVGITPGWTQTSITYKTVRNGLMNNLESENIKKQCLIGFPHPSGVNRHKKTV